MNVVAQPFRRFPVRPGVEVTLAVYYKTTGVAGASFSVIAYDREGEQVQYDNAPALPASDEWREATCNVTLAEDAADLTILLRNHGDGTIYYDSVTLRGAGPAQGEGHAAR